MALATTQKYEELVVEISDDPTTAPAITWSRACGLIDAEITRSANVDTAEIPDCDDESLPLSVERQVRSIEVTASGTGVWALQSNKAMSDWFYSSTTLNARIRNSYAQTNGASGDPYQEAGPALLTTLSNSRTKGQKVTAEIELQFDGTPTVTDVV